MPLLIILRKRTTAPVTPPPAGSVVRKTLTAAPIVRKTLSP